MTEHWALYIPHEVETETVTCGICGKTAAMSEEVADTWYPYAFLGDEEVSPVCPDHPGHWREDYDDCSIWQVALSPGDIVGV